MIYICRSCGWRINERYNNSNIASDSIGRYKIYKHQPFCSDECIQQAKRVPYILTRMQYIADWNEMPKYDAKCPNNISNWKVQRKIRKNTI